MASKLASLLRKNLLSTRRRDFLRDEKGATAVEVGLLALPFFAIIGAILETSLVFLSSQILDSAVQDTTRFIRTGQYQMSNTNLTQFRASMCGRLYGMFDCSKLHIEVEVLTNFNSASISPPVNFSCTNAASCDWTRVETYQTGTRSDIIMAQVYYKWPTMLNFAGVNLANLPTGERVLGAATVFRNEPF